jgi:integrase
MLCLPRRLGTRRGLYSARQHKEQHTPPGNSAEWARTGRCQTALERAKKLGSHYPEDYLFPLRIDRATWDPKQPASRSWLRKQVAYLRELTGIDHITPHIFRHLAVTEMLELGAKEQAVVAVTGWVGRRMFETYSHPRLEAKTEAVALLDKVGTRHPNVQSRKQQCR